MRFGKLRSVGHNVADSLASGIGLMIGIYQMDIFAEAAATPEGYIDVDFLTGLAAGADASSDVVRVAKLYSEALPACASGMVWTLLNSGRSRPASLAGATSNDSR